MKHRFSGRMLEQLFDCRDTLGEAVAALSMWLSTDPGR
jgi:hypothetical protein